MEQSRILTMKHSQNFLLCMIQKIPFLTSLFNLKILLKWFTSRTMVKLADVLVFLLCGFFAGVGGSHIPKRGQSKENLEKCGVLWKRVIFEFKFKISKFKFPKVQVAGKTAAIFLTFNINLFSSLRKYLEFHIQRVILEKLTLSFVNMLVLN